MLATLGRNGARRIHAEQPGWNRANYDIADFLEEGAKSQPLAAEGFIAAAEELRSQVKAGQARSLEVLQQTASDVATLWVDVAGTVITPIGLIDASDEFRRGEISGTEFALSVIPFARVAQKGSVIVRVGSEAPLDVRAFKGEKVGPWQKSTNVDISTNRLNGSLDVPEVPQPHKNSLDYIGDTHVYVIRKPDGSLYKVGESAQGVRKTDGASIRAEQQARQLQRETGDFYTTEIRQNFGGKADARAYETRFIETYIKLYG